MTLEKWALLCTEWFYGYTIYRFMGIFFERNTCKNKKLEWAGYILFCILNSINYIFFFYPILVGLVSCISIFLLSYLYEGKIRTRIIATVIVLMFMFMAETIVVTIGIGMPNIAIKCGVTEEIVVPIAARICDLMMVLIIEKLVHLKLGAEASRWYWFAIIFFPINSILLLSFSSLYIHSAQLYAIWCFFILIINGLIFFLFDRLLAAHDKEDKIILQNMENESYKKQIEILQEWSLRTQKLRHDMKNHLIIIQGLLEQEEGMQALDYVKDMTTTYGINEKIINSGNMELDSLLNYKIEQAVRKNIQPDIRVEIPDILPISSVELTVVIGNLFDNAIEAVEKLPMELRKMKMKIYYNKGRLFISCQNPFYGKLIKKEKFFKTSKRDKRIHGIGLRNVEELVNKYYGKMDIQTEKNNFVVNIILYLGQ